ncbi:uncharacterized protein BCR38DRAFT_448211 [Pseudomassariella vexata]|uniref:Zn(2)-C6 fungal-type domain-containing protein n=1 Tax=Pseudomassariella vexata TaxID=1141098 RepID=A0A1Y2DFS6_9PEZI|nr:uncharacterized protein BCR38DRAFT_448211 [Pseudomassariella vexata]ORY58142.1 hypothetical protein BCR38DRAFT_448211 [Pseudomassariella vexata]
MSNLAISPETPLPPSRSPKLQRVLACVLCQQRKVKCNRSFPCTNCIKSRAQCIPATQVTHHRKDMFPKRELLDRVIKYEDLLRRNNVPFEPLHKDQTGEKQTPNAGNEYVSVDEQSKDVGIDDSSPSGNIKSEKSEEAKAVWNAMTQGLRDPAKDSDSSSSPRDTPGLGVRTAWDHVHENNDLLFGPYKPVDLSSLHPNPVQIFRLWQIYIDNVNPMLKVTHSPTLQSRIIEAASNVRNVDPNLQALMFSIYCMAILSMMDDCEAIFGASKEALLKKYHFSCQKALLNASLLHTSNRDCLTAFFLYLVSVRPSTNPHSLSSLLGLAVRIAQQMGLHSESACAKHPPFEAEMRRRLWRSLTVFDTRIAEIASIASYRPLALAPTWDCRIPLNVNDSDLRPEMKDPPTMQAKSTDAFYVVVRSELGEFARHITYPFEITHSAAKAGTKNVQNSPISGAGGALTALEKRIEDEYLKFCDPEIPLHFMTLWTTRAFLARYRLMEHIYQFLDLTVPQTDAEHDTANAHAIRFLECDTKVIASPLTRGYIWSLHYHFPFPAYFQIMQDLRRRPVSEHSDRAWEVVSDNYLARLVFGDKEHGPRFRVFTSMVLQAWEARDELSIRESQSCSRRRLWCILDMCCHRRREMRLVNIQTKGGRRMLMICRCLCLRVLVTMVCLMDTRERCQ